MSDWFHNSLTLTALVAALFSSPYLPVKPQRSEWSRLAEDRLGLEQSDFDFLGGLTIGLDSTRLFTLLVH